METADYLTKVKRHVDDAIRENTKAGVEVPEHKYLDIALQHTKTLYANEANQSGSRRKHFWSRDDLSGIMTIWQGLRPELQKHIPESIMKYKSRRMVTEINAVSAEALISAAMKEAGLKYEFFPQTYRAKVHVKISERNKVVIYLNYKKIGELLPKTMEALKAIESAMEQLGTSSSIQRTAWYDNFK